MPSSDDQRERKEFGQRLRSARLATGFTQEQMAYALGINPARYSKYEIGRSEAPYTILSRIAEVADTDLNYLLSGRIRQQGRRRETPSDQLVELLKAIPVPAILYDRDRRLVSFNNELRDTFFPENPKSLLRRGTPQEVLIRAWAHSIGLGPSKIRAYVRIRLDSRIYAKSPVELQVGARRLNIAETVDTDRRLVLISDLTAPNRIIL